MELPEPEPLNLRRAAADIDAITKLYQGGKLESFIPILPALALKGVPYSLSNHPPFEPLFNLRVPRRIYWKTGRQVSKTTGLAAQSVLQTATQAHFATLFIAPRFEQIRRVSTNYVRPFIEQSLISNLITNTSVESSVLQKSFLNHAKMFFSFAFLDVERVRGISADCTKYDEIQDIDIDFIPVIRECMSASKFAIEMFFGTPKTLDNTLQALWETSSQAEWHVRCESCRHDNIPSIDHDLLKMIGSRGPVCAKCGHQIQPRIGRWVHGNPSRMTTDAGYHVPQIVMPMHYENLDRPGVLPGVATEKWLELLGKRDGRGGYTEGKFLNEVLGESCDVGVKLVTLTDIKKASTLNKNEERDALKAVRSYRYRALGVDWGGGGENMVSFTTCAVVGINPQNGNMECIFAKRFHSAYSHAEEAAALIRIFTSFQCHYFCHDYGGSGSVREALMIQAGLPMSKILPFMYVRASAKKMVEAKRPSGYNQRAYYTLDKARSLVLQAQCLKTGTIALPEYESSKDITHDLLALTEEKHDTLSAADMYLVVRNPKMSDDFAHALNYACIGIWNTHRCFPDLSKLNAIKLTPAQAAEFAEPDIQQWD